MSRRTIAWAFSCLSVAGLIGMAFLLGSCPVVIPPPPPEVSRARAVSPYEVELRILDGKLQPGWENWGWGRHEAADSGIRIDFSGHGGIILRHSKLAAPFGGLLFKYLAPAGFGYFLDVVLKSTPPGGKEFPRVPVGAHHTAQLPDGWQEVLVPWNALNPEGAPFDRIVIRARRSVARDWVTLDHVVLTKPVTTDAPRAQPPSKGRPAALAVRCDKPGGPISSMIYGIAAGEISTGETAHRVGGNTMSRFNWELRAWNTGSDWYFENVQVDDGLEAWLAGTRKNNLKMAVTVPMLGWVAKDGSSVGFPVSKFGKQAGHDPHRAEAGNGRAPDGKELRPGPPTETSVPAPPELIKRWITKLRDGDRERGSRSVDVYMLDNEPGLWHETHRDVHPDPVTYDELLDRTIRYGTAVREADPEAVIAGPAEWGWPGYFYSAKDLAAGVWLRPDRRAHGDVPLLPWYLQKLAEHERKTGVRVLDWVDVHFYPQASGVYAGAATDAKTSALRLRSTRALWDPDYLDESWINERINLVPRLKQWIADYYPGRGIVLGEWSFGAEEHISGGLAIAEALGRFGQLGLNAAFYWRTIARGTPAHEAFRAFRNYDGQGGRFLDWSVPTAEVPGVSLFASRDEARSRLVLVVLNLDSDLAADARIDLGRCGAIGSRRVFTYASGSKSLASAAIQKDDALEAQGIVTQALPPSSLAVVEIGLSPAAP